MKGAGDSWMNPMTRQFSNMGVLVRNYGKKLVLDNIVIGSYIFANKLLKLNV